MSSTLNDQERDSIRKVLTLDLKTLHLEDRFYPVHENKEKFLKERETVYRTLLYFHCPGWDEK